MKPLSALALYDAFSSENNSVLIRLGKGITRGYPGTNESAIFALNSEGRSPQWNIVVTNAEFQYNSAIITSTNNPDPSGLLTLWVGE